MMMREKLLRGVLGGLLGLTGVLHAGPVSAAPPGCGADQADWVVRRDGYSGIVTVTTGDGEEPSGTHQRFVEPLPLEELELHSPALDAFHGYAVFDGGAPRVWERGYSWTVRTTPWSPGGTASLLGPACAPGSTTVESAIYRFEADPVAGHTGLTTVWGILTRDL